MPVPKLDLDEITYKPAPVDYKVLDQIFKNEYRTFEEAAAEQRQKEVADLQYEKVKRDAAEDKAHEDLRTRIKDISTAGGADEDAIYNQVGTEALKAGDLDTYLKTQEKRQTHEQQKYAKKLTTYGVLLRNDPAAAKAFAELNGMEELSGLNVRQRINPYTGAGEYDYQTGQYNVIVPPQQRPAAPQNDQMRTFINNKGELIDVDVTNREEYREATRRGFYPKGTADVVPEAVEEKAPSPRLGERASSFLNNLIPKSGASTAAGGEGPPPGSTPTGRTVKGRPSYKTPDGRIWY